MICTDLAIIHVVSFRVSLVKSAQVYWMNIARFILYLTSDTIVAPGSFSKSTDESSVPTIDLTVSAIKGYLIRLVAINSPSPSGTYMGQLSRPYLVQLMTCRLSGVCSKSLFEPTLVQGWLNPWEQISVKIDSNYSNFSSIKCIWKRILQYSVT